MCAQRRLRSTWASAQTDQSSLSAWRKLGSLATHWAHNEDSGQSGRLSRLIWVFAGRIVILLVLSWGGSYVPKRYDYLRNILILKIRVPCCKNIFSFFISQQKHQNNNLILYIRHIHWAFKIQPISCHFICLILPETFDQEQQER